MSLYEAVVESSRLDALNKILHNLFLEYDRSVREYKNSIDETNINIDLDNTNLEAVMDVIDNKENIKNSLNNVISKLNKIQVVFEKLNYSVDTSIPEDVNEGNFLNQLDRFSEQCLRLDENFDRASFNAFYNDLSYLTALSEAHYNRIFGELNENIDISDKVEESLEETEEYLESLPKIQTNEINN